VRGRRYDAAMSNPAVAAASLPRILSLFGGVRAVAAIWFLVSLTDSFRAVTYMRTTGRAVHYASLAVYAIGETITWTVATLFLLWLIDRWPKGGRTVSMLLAAVVLLTGTLVSIASSSMLFSLTGITHRTFPRTFFIQLPRQFHSSMMVVVFVLMVAIHMRDRNAAEARRMRESRLENELLQAQLHSVSAQFQPHFLFNTLHGITAMLHKDTGRAERMITDLGDLLRFSLTHARDAAGTLDDELYFIERYLFLQHTRLGERLKVTLDAGDEARRSLFPRFVLQPLVENAVKHGIDVVDRPGEIAISAQVHGGLLTVRIRNTVPGSLQWRPDGVGLSSVRQRLQLLYGTAHTFELTQSDDLVTATITVPHAGS
jgi:two-component system, LytTR family, sensor kinase